MSEDTKDNKETMSEGPKPVNLANMTIIVDDSDEEEEEDTTVSNQFEGQFSLLYFSPPSPS